MITIIDYDAGNIRSVAKAFEAIGEDVLVTSDPAKIESASKVVLPGVGAFGDAMKHLEELNLCEAILRVCDKGVPFLGICLGLQLLFEDSEESKGVKGLGILPGHILKIKDVPGLKIPQIGWNSLNYPNEGELFRGVPEESYVYFVHSFYASCMEPSHVKATCVYGETLVHASVQKDNVFACQFHPEKSSRVGRKILENFVNI